MTGGHGRRRSTRATVLAFARSSSAGAFLAAARPCCGWPAHLTLLLTGHGWADAPFADHPTLLRRAGRRRRRPTAWAAPTPTRRPLASRSRCSGLVTVAHLGSSSACSSRAAGRLAWADATAPRGPTPPGGPPHRQERRIAVPSDPSKRPWRLVAGARPSRRRLLAGDDCVSAVVFGPNGSGKTTSLIVPNVLDWDGPVVMTTAKPQDLEPICTARAARGPVWVIAPGGAPGHDVRRLVPGRSPRSTTRQPTGSPSGWSSPPA